MAGVAGPGPQFLWERLEFEVQLILRREDVPSLNCVLRMEGPLCLGWHTWFKSGGDFDRNPGDTILLLGDA
jgi:predicted component of type VI protein secretion system